MLPPNSLFHRFLEPIPSDELPERLNNPFEGSPYHIAITAALQLYDKIENTEWNHNFGIDRRTEKSIGKMFGVLVVATDHGEVGYLAGFSGKIGESNHFAGFVPPVYDALEAESFLKQGMDRLADFNRKIKLLEGDSSAIMDEERAQLFQQRRQNSDALQERIYQSYEFLNSNGKAKNLKEIFDLAGYKNPPGGAGECAAPKLFQYAFENKLRPVALAEFWWGVSPKSGNYLHKQYYPSCDHKCRPILGHMLEGLVTF